MSAAKVATISRPTAEPSTAEPSDAPALGFSLQVDLGAGRVCTLQTFLPNHCDLAALDAMLDKMTHAGDRQRAHYRLEELQRDLLKEEKDYRNIEEDLERLDLEHAAKLEKLTTEASEAQARLDDFTRAAKDAHVARGGRGAYQLKGGDKQNYERVQTAVTQRKAEIHKAEEERAIHHGQIEVTQKRRREIIESLAQKIDECRRIVDRTG